MHRPATVDNREGCQFIVDLPPKPLRLGARGLPHPPKNAKEFGVVWACRCARASRIEADAAHGLLRVPALDLQGQDGRHRLGGIQEETTYRQVPCITLRPNTERPSTTTLGTNQMLTELNVADVMHAIDNPKEGVVPPLWDGHATERIIDVIRAL